METQEPTIADVLQAVNVMSGHMDQRFDALETRMTRVETRLTTVESTMVTKDYLDNKLADLRGDLVVLVRKEDTKFKSLLELLFAKKILSEQELNSILTQEPFAKLIV